MKNLRLLISVIVISVCTFSAIGGTVAGFQGRTDLQRFRWKDRSIKLVISTSLIKASANVKADSDVLGAVRRSVQAWQDAADIEFKIDTSDRQSVSPAGVSGDGVSLITIAQTPENVLFFAKDAQTVSAKTRVFYNRKGFITEGDIVLNPFQEFSTDGTYGTFDLQSALTHEIGHLLGLRHSGVMGAAMSESLAKNSSVAAGEFTSRGLSESDAATARELYGVDKDIEDCCAAVSGKLTLVTGKTGKNLKVWAEEAETGRVVAQADTAFDGSYRVGGLSIGSYNLYWKSRANVSASGVIGAVNVEKVESLTLNQKINLEPAGFTLEYVGINSQLTDSAVAIRSGSEKTIYIGGKNLDPMSLDLEISSPFVHIAAGSVTKQDFGEGVTVISFIAVADENAPRGLYTISALAPNGTRVSLVGSLRVD